MNLDKPDHHMKSKLTFCISTYNNLPYLKLAIDSVRKNSYYKDAPFIIHAENCDDGTNEWLMENHLKYNLQIYIQSNELPMGIGGGMNFCAEHVKTEYIMFLHSDFYVTSNWDKELMESFEKYPLEKLWVNSWRVEPEMFHGSATTPGNVVVPKDTFGEYYYNFNADFFDLWATDFTTMNPNIEIPRGLGVSCLIRKSDWDEIGGNDPRFAPTSWDDHDLFLRMRQSNFKFITVSNSLIYHFGARGSHRLEENNNQSSDRQMLAEQKNAQKFYDKWGGMPKFDEYGQIIGLQ
ncbi:COG1216 Predicted glycosyltransferases [uncultured Caudovirales phage]|uniref:COG1216 Predicted glycosyltransferases n=1 Tax=uncultured Caudovirales phage TaxID=2100421 RepID=A0A6J5RW63_9CAUD|nr:COG1216 Predicted glycosyltransferases [uncultured Caudovirales phage]CAB4170521.1 COG1216 Predicted glycosyltransferases [uncultured Caudovirales phage]CAB4198577.1 COG1216 Predicted glycosyltransferases [uncultured Caudovirales phage]